MILHMQFGSVAELAVVADGGAPILWSSEWPVDSIRCGGGRSEVQWPFLIHVHFVSRQKFWIYFSGFFIIIRRK